MPPKKASSANDDTPKEKMKDKNAPKGPSNAYTIFYKHFHSEFRKKNPQTNLGGQQLTQLVAEAWKSLSEEEKRPFQERAEIDRKKYLIEMEAYKKTENYKKFIEDSKSLTKLGSVDIFSKEFLAYNKNRESELRTLRRKISSIEERVGEINDRIDNLKRKLDTSYKALPSAKRIHFEKDRQIVIWCRELVCELDKARLLEELEITYDTPADRVIQKLNENLEDPALADKLKKLFSGFVLEIF